MVRSQAGFVWSHVSEQADTGSDMSLMRYVKSLARDLNSECFRWDETWMKKGVLIIRLCSLCWDGLHQLSIVKAIHTRTSGMRDSHMSQVALIFLCQPSFSNHLFLLVTAPHSCPCGVVMNVDAQFMQPMGPSVASAIITSLWCLVFVVWCPQPPLLFLIHSLHHPLVVQCVVIT